MLHRVTRPGREILLESLNRVSGTNFKPEDLVFESPETITDPEYNARVFVRGTENSPFYDNKHVRYNRVDLNAFFTRYRARFTIEAGEYVLADVLALIDEVYGSQLLEEDFEVIEGVIEDDTTINITLRAAADSLLFFGEASLELRAMEALEGDNFLLHLGVYQPAPWEINEPFGHHFDESGKLVYSTLKVGSSHYDDYQNFVLGPIPVWNESYEQWDAVEGKFATSWKWESLTRHLGDLPSQMYFIDDTDPLRGIDIEFYITTDMVGWGVQFRQNWAESSSGETVIPTLVPGERTLFRVSERWVAGDAPVWNNIQMSRDAPFELRPLVLGSETQFVARTSRWGGELVSVQYQGNGQWNFGDGSVLTVDSETGETTLVIGTSLRSLEFQDRSGVREFYNPDPANPPAIFHYLEGTQSFEFSHDGYLSYPPVLSPGDSHPSTSWRGTYNMFILWLTPETPPGTTYRFRYDVAHPSTDLMIGDRITVEYDKNIYYGWKEIGLVSTPPARNYHTDIVIPSGFVGVRTARESGFDGYQKGLVWMGVMSDGLVTLRQIIISDGNGTGEYFDQPRELTYTFSLPNGDQPPEQNSETPRNPVMYASYKGNGTIQIVGRQAVYEFYVWDMLWRLQEVESGPIEIYTYEETDGYPDYYVQSYGGRNYVDHYESKDNAMLLCENEGVLSLATVWSGSELYFYPAVAPAAPYTHYAIHPTGLVYYDPNNTSGLIYTWEEGMDELLEYALPESTVGKQITIVYTDYPKASWYSGHLGLIVHPDNAIYYSNEFSGGSDAEFEPEPAFSGIDLTRAVWLCAWRIFATDPAQPGALIEHTYLPNESSPTTIVHPPVDAIFQTIENPSPLTQPLTPARVSWNYTGVYMEYLTASGQLCCFEERGAEEEEPAS